VAQVTNAEGTIVTLCDKYAWDPETVDVNIPDNTPMSPGQEFVKTWKIKNIGACTWGEGYKMVFSYGEEMEGVAQPLGAAIAPGQEVDVSAEITASTHVRLPLNFGMFLPGDIFGRAARTAMKFDFGVEYRF
jgi:hypothetical protein